MNRDFLKEAIADAKAVKESAIANAKVALEEAFSPQLHAMFAQKLEEMDKEEMEEGYDEVDEEVEMTDEAMDKKEDIDLDEILAELEKSEDLEDKEITEAEEEEAEDDNRRRHYNSNFSVFTAFVARQWSNKFISCMLFHYMSRPACNS